MKDVLQNYLGQTIGINYEKPFRIDAAELTAVNADHFSIKDTHKGYTHHFSYLSIVQIIEHPEGIEVGGLFSHKQNFTLVIKVGHLVEYVPA